MHSTVRAGLTTGWLGRRPRRRAAVARARLRVLPAVAWMVAVALGACADGGQSGTESGCLPPWATTELADGSMMDTRTFADDEDAGAEEDDHPPVNVTSTDHADRCRAQ